MESDAEDLLRHLGVHPRGVASDSRTVRPGEVFLAFPGETADGRRFIPQAIEAGAAGVMWEAVGFRWDPAWQVPHVPVPGLRSRAGEIAAWVLGRPSARMEVIGVTGTNGKTSVTHWVAEALTALGRRAAFVGTLGNGFPGALSPARNTTPGPVELQTLLAGYVDAGAKACAMEVSSHGLDQGRVAGMHFACAALTNLSRDHLDYHGDMAAYAGAKARLFDWPELGAAVLNADDDFGVEILSSIAMRDRRVLTYGIDAGDVRAADVHASAAGLAMRIVTPGGVVRLDSSLIGRFNAYNLLCALAILLVLDVAPGDAAAALSRVAAPAGRMQRFGGGDRPLVIVDYAHTPDALEKVLATLRDLSPRTLTCVFGCGGNRDRGKRPLMGAIAARHADIVWLTSDNPRDEDPEHIITAIAAGLGDAPYRVEPDRRVAIRDAIADAGPADIVLVAGKGHEDYQEVRGIRLPFADAAVVEEVLGT